MICTASGSKSHLGKVAFIDQDYGYAFGGFMGQITPKKEVEERFLFYVLTSSIYKKYIDELSDGVNINNLKYDQLGQFPVIVPPLPEQRRIVAILDEAFEGIATAKADAEKNLQNAREVFESHLNAVFSQRGECWVEKRLGDISKINYGYTTSACYEPIGPHFLRITDIQNNNVNWDSVPFCAIDDSDRKKYLIVNGDIVFARTGATTGKSYLVGDSPEAIFASYLIRVRLTTKDLISSFLYLFFQTASYWESIKNGSSGSAQGGFNATKLSALTIPYPSIRGKQQRVIAELREIADETQHLESIYQQKLTALDELKQSLLHQAFNGDL
ncbi:restriction endonuclease subunit S [Acidithiobacillus thiooxidans]|uniref:restriction endonuclease subunit S n=1 Tax=Acidithiobacillus thiooxidans TaxID=930 RepID=UPI001C06EA80|nr:restriction endonuclease subunit S [Acidithiobacillus thiooxidans]MBU2843147.1 hypothetical protein [Acidithiobacillus thiooxidans]